MQRKWFARGMTLIFCGAVFACAQGASAKQTSTSILPASTGAVYRSFVAQELGWVKSDSICRGYFESTAPGVLGAKPQGVRDETSTLTSEGPVELRASGVSVLRDHVVVTQPGRRALADIAYVYRDKDGRVTKVILKGHVRLEEWGSFVLTDKATLFFDPQYMTLTHTAFHFYSGKSKFRNAAGPFDAWGTASGGHRDAATVTTIYDATYSTCNPENPTWQLKAKKIVIDKPHNRGEAYNGHIDVGGVPVFYTPYYQFPVTHERKTGFLSPILGYSSAKSGSNLSSGAVLGWPFYWNMAPNYDWLLTPEYYGDNGFRLTSLFRYLTPNDWGQVYFNFLPDDTNFENFRTTALATYSNTTLYPASTYQPYLTELADETNQRFFGSFQESGHYLERLSWRFDLNYVTDPYYFSDITVDSIAPSDTNQLLNLGQVNYEAPNWLVSGWFQAYQTLNLITQISDQNEALSQYERLPEITATAYYPDILPNLDFAFDSDATDFYYTSILQDEPNGQRLHVRPQFKYNFENRMGYIKPTVAVDNVSYLVQEINPGVSSSAERTLPIADVDAGLYFRQQFSWFKHPFSQTFEPRLFYLYVPYTDQDDLPNFDTTLLPFYYDQLFDVNLFNGIDRFENANQMSAGFTTRILSDENGATILKADLGQSYLFASNQVCLSAGCTLPDSQFSPLVGDLYYYITHSWTISGSLAWNMDANAINNAASNVMYSRDGKHILFAGYSFVGADPYSLATFSGTVNDSVAYSNYTDYLTFGGAWPLIRGWSAVGYMNYNFQQTRVESIYGGLSYDTCCWALRFVVDHTYSSTALNANGTPIDAYNNTYYIQIRLKGFSDFGSGGTDALLRRTIPGIEP